MHLVDTLRKLLSSSAPATGIVERVSSTQAWVRTKHGIVPYSLNGFVVASGQKVLLTSAGIVGIVPSARAATVYDV